MSLGSALELGDSHVTFTYSCSSMEGDTPVAHDVSGQRQLVDNDVVARAEDAGPRAMESLKHGPSVAAVDDE